MSAPSHKGFFANGIIVQFCMHCTLTTSKLDYYTVISKEIIHNFGVNHCSKCVEQVDWGKHGIEKVGELSGGGTEGGRNGEVVD